MSYIEDLMAEWGRNYELYVKADEEAREKGTLVGRYIEFPIGDGAAVYRVVKSNATMSEIEVITGIGDDWVIPHIGERGRIPTEQVKRIIEGREKMAALFGHSR